MSSACELPNFSSGNRSYRKYPEAVKREVSRTKNVYLFPDLKIPRTTAQYWVKRQKPFGTAEVVDIEYAYKKKAEFLERELAKEKALRILLETVRKVFPFDFRIKKLKNKQARAQIIAAIQECLSFHKVSHCLDAIGLPESSYRRWASEISLCQKAKSPCGRRKATQLTEDEIAAMKKFVLSKKHAHVSITSLHLLAQRMGELFCSLDTWYKYIRAYEWKRPWVKLEKNYKKIGIRATKPNEIWHIDVTKVSVGSLVFYIQAVIDNFSRFILAWGITTEMNAKITVETLAKAKLKAKELLNLEESSNVMMDPGKENDNHAVLKFITSKNLTRTLAQVDVHYSDSMVEGLFHALKNKFLYHQKIKGLEDLTRKVNFFFKQHNEAIPQAVLKGGKPREVFISQWGKVELEELQKNKAEALVARKKKNQEPPCKVCPL